MEEITLEKKLEFEMEFQRKLETTLEMDLNTNSEMESQIELEPDIPIVEPLYTKRKYHGTCLIPIDTTNLVCPNMNIKKLPGPIELKFIEELDCSDNSISEIPYYPNLKWARLKNNLLKTFPGHLSHLCYLNISRNPLGSTYKLPGKEQLPALEVLICSNTGISTIEAYPLLKVLDCSGNKLAHLPGEHSFPNLEFLNCNYNQIKIIEYYPRLVTLWCAGNKYISIPDYLLKIISIDCHNCHLVKMPMAKKLRYLDCSNNKITVLESYSKQLIWLDCSNNKMKDLPHEVRGLRYFRATGNKFNTKEPMPLLSKVRVYEIDSSAMGYWDPVKTAIMQKKK